MKADIKVPAMGESITEATVGELLVPSGSAVSVDQEILELETDKVNQVLYAPESGVLNLTVSPDETVTIGQVIGYVDTDGTPSAAAEQPTKKEAAQPKEQSAPAPAPAAAVESKPQPASGGEGVRHNKQAFVAGLTAPAPAPAAAPSTRAAAPSGGETRQKMSRIRKVIAKRLVEAQQSTAMLTTFNEVDLTEVMALRKAHQDKFVNKYGVKLGFMSFFVRAAVAALKEVPGINSYIDGEEIVERHYYHIGIAVSSDRGLMVPVLRDADQLSFAEIEQGIANFAKRAREGGLSPDDLMGGGFTITNGGIFGSLLSTPILNPPQSGILGMHKIQKRPMVVNDEIVVRPMMYLALSYDHRIVDGKEAVTFLVNIKDSLEDPARLLIDV